MSGYYRPFDNFVIDDVYHIDATVDPPGRMPEGDVTPFVCQSFIVSHGTAKTDPYYRRWKRIALRELRKFVGKDRKVTNLRCIGPMWKK